MDTLSGYHLLICFIVWTQEVLTHDFYFDPSPHGFAVVDGKEALLRCDVSDRNSIMFRWELNNKKVANTTRRYQEDSNLRIVSVDRHLDEGSFVCIATNSTTMISVRSSSASLDILWIDITASVQLKTPNTPEEIVLNEEVQLRCECDGVPEPQVEWYRNGNRLDETEGIRFSKNRLRILNVSPADNAIYACAAFNQAGRVESSHPDFLLSVHGEGAAELVTETFTQMALVRRGDSARFDCQYRNALLTEWYFRDSLLNNMNRTESNSRFVVFPNGSLVINDVRGRDVGGYKCVGISEQGPVQAFLAKLVLAYLSELTSDSFDPALPPDGGPVVLPVGGHYEVTCQLPDGLPAPQLSWADKRGQPVATRDDGEEAPATRVYSEGATLYLNDIMPEDSGNYTCVVQNLAGVQRRAVWIMVSVAPQLLQSPTSERVHEGESVRFGCSYVGTPYPVTQVTWQREGLPVDEANPRFQVNRAEATLLITNIQHSDEGNYACVIETYGHAPLTSFNARLYVWKMLKFRPPPVDRKLELGSLNARVYCHADGQSPPSVRWTRVGEPSLGRDARDNGGILEFDVVKYEHAGNYMCEAENTDGKINKTIEIDVVVMPWIKVLPMNTTAHEGFPTMVHCVADGDPKPSIRWDKNGEVTAVDDNPRFQILANGSLSILVTYMEDIGRYGCTAGSSAGFSRAEMYLQVTNSLPETETAQRLDMIKTIIIAVCAAVAYLGVVIGLAVYCSIRLVRRKAAKNKRNDATDTHAANGRVENGHVPNETSELMHHVGGDLSAISPLLMPIDDAKSAISSHNSSSQPGGAVLSGAPGSVRSSTRSSSGAGASGLTNGGRFSFPRESLHIVGLLGKGNYGDVLLANAHQLEEKKQMSLVMIKTLLARDDLAIREYRRDFEIYSRVQNEYVVKLLGVCCEMEPQYLIFEYPEWGDLKQFLVAMHNESSKTLKIQRINQAQKLTMCNQVALGMEYLASQHFVHKDLAARNIFLQPNLDIKISSAGLCRDVYANEYYQPSPALFVPLRWLAPECIDALDRFTTQSDIWAFGCFIFEVFSLGDMPYRYRTDDEVLARLRSGDCALDEKPVDCPPELWDLVLRCTSDCAHDRPFFSEICVSLAEMPVDSDV